MPESLAGLNDSSFPQDLFGLPTIIPSILISSLAIIFNSVLILVLVLDPFHELRSSSTIFVANLAVADVLTGILTLSKTSFVYFGGVRITDIALILGFSAFWTMQCSIFTVLLITCERILAVLKPMKFKTWVTKRRCFLLSLGTWIVSLLDFTVLNSVDDSGRSTMLLVGVLNLLAIFAVVFGYFYLYKLLKKKRNEMLRYVVPELSEAENSNAASNESENFAARLRRKQKAFAENKKLVNTFLMVTVVLVITMVPMTVVAIVTAFCKDASCITIYYIAAKYEPIILFNFIVNPVIYAFRLPQYRKAFYTVLKCESPSNAVGPMAM